MGDVQLPDSFFGRFKLERSENFDEFLASRGVGWILRKMIAFSSVTKVFAPDPQAPGKLVMENLTSKKNLKYAGIELGKPFHAEGLDGKEHEITFSLTDEGLLEKHVRPDDPNDKGETYVYTRDGDHLVLKMQNEQVTCKRWFKKEKEAQ